MRHPNKICFKDGNRQVTFGEFDRHTSAIARGLIDKGLKPGDRVCVLTNNCVEGIEAIWGTMKADGIPVPIHHATLPAELEAIFKNIEPKIMVIGNDYLGKLESIGADARTWTDLFVLRGGKGAAYPDIEFLIAGYPSDPIDSKAANDDTAVIILTGGTTGLPKGAMVTHSNLFTACLTLNFTSARYQDDKLLLFLSFCNSAGFGLVASHMIRGITIVLQNGFDPERFLKTIQDEKITLTLGAPPIFWKLLQYPDIDRYDTSSMRLVPYGTAPMSVPLLRQLLSKFKWGFQNGYGATEVMANSISVLEPADHLLDGSPEMEKRIESVGRESVDAIVRIFDDADQELPAGTVGEIVVRGPHVMKGYWRQPEVTAETLRNGWLHTGDMGYMDEGGYIFMVDRKKDMVISGGFNVYPKELENLLKTHPSVLECAVIGVPHEKWGETPLAFVILRPGMPAPTEEELMLFCRERIAAYKLPNGGIKFITELPRTSQGKVAKTVLKEKYGKATK
ncbi:MAG: AMP-binding protein [Syntrophales bacterium]|nr:AMP-binding protein [Syntrophales bacterium]